MSSSASASASATQPESKTQTKKVLFVAVDIEKAGALLTKHPIISIGHVLVSRTIEVAADKSERIVSDRLIEGRRFNFLVVWSSVEEGGSFEKRCYDEFWSKLDQKIIDGCRADALSTKEGWATYAAWLTSLEKNFPDHKVKFLTDNASFDVASIDYNLEVWANRLPMRYSSNNRYRAVVSADDMLEAVPEPFQKVAFEFVRKNSNHDHNPINDAYSIWLQFMVADAFKRLHETAIPALSLESFEDFLSKKEVELVSAGPNWV